MIYDSAGEAIDYEPALTGHMGEQPVGTGKIVISVDENPTVWEGTETATYGG